MATFVRTQEIEHVIGDDGRFRLRVTSPDVELRGADGDVARVRVDFEVRADSDAEADAALEHVRYVARRGDGVLELGEPKRETSGVGAIAGIFGRSPRTVRARVVAELPRRAVVGFTGVSADLVAVGLHGMQEYRTVSGDLVLTEVAGSVAVNGVSGDVSLRADEPIALRANTVSGDLSIFAPRLDETRIVTVSGDVELEGYFAHGAAHQLETVSGDLSLGVAGGLTLEVRGLSSDVGVSLPHRTEGTRDRRRYVIGDGSSTVLFSSMSGDVTVHTSRRVGASPPPPPAPPRPPVPPRPPAPPRPAHPIGDDEQLAVLRALEAGEIDVDEAARRLAGGPADG